MATKPAKSPSGNYVVKLSERFPHGGFDYLPRHGEITVDQEMFDAMWKAGVVAEVNGI